METLWPTRALQGQRADPVPNTPAFAEAGTSDFVAATWGDFLAPTGLTAALREKIGKDISAIIATPPMTKKLVEMGGAIVNSNPAEFDALVGKEVAKWAEAVRTSGAQMN